MGIIHVMSDKLASQVAAGEVVERPESVVRELVDNAIDAGARHIEVRVERGGVGLIAVGDDGQGMTRDDALLSLERHATSKLRRIEDLQHLHTLGFRGEALPSIASVGRLRLRTRQPGAIAGTLIEVEGGVVRDVREDGCAPGTLVEVRQLFFNVPARRKFLRSEATEFGHIDQRLRLVAAGQPSIGFSLFHDGKEIFRVASGQDRRNRVRELLGSEVARVMLPVHGGEDGARLDGLASRPGFSRPTRRMVLFFVNGRPVESPVLRGAVAEAYAGLVEKGSHPACVLFLELNPAVFDINVHPAKREIRLRDPLAIQRLIRESLTTALHPSAVPRPAIVPSTSPPAQDAPFPSPADEHDDPPVPGDSAGGTITLPAPATGSNTGRPAKGDAPPVDTTAWEAPARQVPTTPDMPGLFAGPLPDTETPGGLANARHLGTVLGSYEIFTMDDGLLLMERRAAIERILFEWLGTHRGQADASQALLLPITLALAPQEWEDIEPHLDALRALGLGVEPFGPRTLLLTALPAMVQTEDPGALARLVLGAVRAAAQGKRGPLEKRALLTVVSRELAGGGRALPEFGHGQELLHRLLACEMPYCCPRGRATLSQLSRHDLARRFGLA